MPGESTRDETARTVNREPERYDAAAAAAYWSGPRHEASTEIAAVLSLGEPPAVNDAYDSWEAGLLLDSLPPGLHGRVLDLAAGVGRVSVRLSTRARMVVCGDLAPGMLERLRRRAAQEGKSNLAPVRFRSDRIPIRDGALDLVACLGLIEHLPPDTRRATLDEASRTLRRGGLLFLVLNNEASRLLRDPGDNPLRVAAQQPNGYYCAVVSEADVIAQLDSACAHSVIGSNLFYSLQRHAARLLSEAARGDERLRPFFTIAAEWDRAVRPLGPLARGAADHHLHLWVRR